MCRVIMCSSFSFCSFNLRIVKRYLGIIRKKIKKKFLDKIMALWDIHDIWEKLMFVWSKFNCIEKLITSIRKFKENSGHYYKVLLYCKRSLNYLNFVSVLRYCHCLYYHSNHYSTKTVICIQTWFCDAVIPYCLSDIYDKGAQCQMHTCGS